MVCVGLFSLIERRDYGEWHFRYDCDLGGQEWIGAYQRTFEWLMDRYNSKSRT